MSLVLAATFASGGSAATQMRTDGLQPAPVAGGGEISASNPERGDGFADLGACQAVLGEIATNAGTAGNARSDRDSGRAGSVFNRAQGNISRCELIDGEYLLVVAPRS